jgi:hypothetical protein
MRRKLHRNEQKFKGDWRVNTANLKFQGHLTLERDSAMVRDIVLDPGQIDMQKAYKK